MRIPITQEQIRLVLIHKPDISLYDALRFACPDCEGFIPNNNHIGEYSGAISRKDSNKEICSNCGTNEALSEVQKSLVDQAVKSE